MHTLSPAFVPEPPCEVCSVIRTRGWSSWFGGEKNDLRHVWRGAPRLVRPHAAAGSGSAVRPVPDLPGSGSAAGGLPPVRQGEARAAGVPGWRTAATPSALPAIVGRRCRSGTIQDVAKELHLDWQTVKALEMEYMREQLERAATPGPKVIGIDEISIGKGHSYRIVVSDLDRRRPIWFGGTGPLRGEHGRVLSSGWGRRKARKIRLAVMDMWKPFRNSTLKAGNAPQAAILFDKFHILRHLGEALDKVRKQRIRPAHRQGPALHQGPEVHACCRTATTSTLEGRKVAASCCSRPTGG